MRAKHAFAICNNIDLFLFCSRAFVFLSAFSASVKNDTPPTCYFSLQHGHANNQHIAQGSVLSYHMLSTSAKLVVIPEAEKVLALEENCVRPSNWGATFWKADVEDTEGDEVEYFIKVCPRAVESRGSD